VQYFGRLLEELYEAVGGACTPHPTPLHSGTWAADSRMKKTRIDYVFMNTVD
jgi:hypothetical protein